MALICLVAQASYGKTADLSPAGFGQKLREAMDQRREHHIELGDATRAQDGREFYRCSLLATLREREVARVGAEMANCKGLPSAPPRTARA